MFKYILMRANRALLIVTIGALALLLVEEWRLRYHSARHPVTVAAESAPASQNSRAAREDEVAKPKLLNWAAIESTDYREYIANLRKTGCPEQTVRDIIIADINALYASKRRELLNMEGSVNYWQSGGSLRDTVGKNLKEGCQALDAERRRVLKELLGLDVPEDASVTSLSQAELNEAALNFLPAEKRAAVVQFVNQSDEQFRGQILPLSGQDDNAFREAYKKWKADRNANLSALFSSTEQDEYNLRYSEVASYLRFRYSSQLSEEQFRQLVVYGEQFEDAIDLRTMNQYDADSRTKHSEAGLALHNKVLEVTGVAKIGVPIGDRTASRFGIK